MTPATDHIHTFPVPAGYSPEQAWEQHSRGERLPVDPACDWVSLTIRGGRQIGQFWRGGKLVRWEAT